MWMWVFFFYLQGILLKISAVIKIHDSLVCVCVEGGVASSSYMISFIY